MPRAHQENVHFPRPQKIDDEKLGSFYQEIRKIRFVKAVSLQLDRTNSIR